MVKSTVETVGKFGFFLGEGRGFPGGLESKTDERYDV
jgi:hypothetical protein